MLSVMKALNLPGCTIEHKIAKAILTTQMGNKRTKFEITMIESPTFFGHWAIRATVGDKPHVFPLTENGLDVVIEGIR